jgi:hypothetical protein
MNGDATTERFSPWHLVDVAVVLGIAFYGQHAGGLTEILVHNGLALAATLIVLFVLGRSGAALDPTTRRLLTIATIAAMGTIATR